MITRTLSDPEARRLARKSWRWLLRLTGHRTFVRASLTSSAETFVAIRGDVRGLVSSRLLGLGFTEEGR